MALCCSCALDRPKEELEAWRREHEETPVHWPTPGEFKVSNEDGEEQTAEDYRCQWCGDALFVCCC